jgi:hypothetical protein
VQEVRWEGDGTELAGKYRKRNENQKLGTGSFMHNGIILAVKMVGVGSDRVSYILLRGRWCHIILLNVEPKQKIKLMMRRTAPTKNCNACSIHSLNTM